MNSKEYQAFVEEVWVSDGKPFDNQIAIAALGLVGESGEVSEHIKKYLRGTHKLNVEEVELELGDVLYYINKLANLLKLDFKTIRQKNVDKLSKRYKKFAGTSGNGVIA